jgi:ferredoxin--NADP+ reductase
VRTSAFERLAGFSLQPNHTHVFLCGNPEMIGLQAHSPEHSATGMIAILEERAFCIHDHTHQGNIHFERYY